MSSLRTFFGFGYSTGIAKEKERKEKKRSTVEKIESTTGRIKKLHFTRNVVFPSGGSF